MLKRILASVAFLACSAAIASSADIAMRDDGGQTIITVSGLLKDYDARVFLSMTADVRSGTVVLNSPGGSLYAGLEIGKAIRRLGLATRVSSRRGLCSSACAFSWLSGQPRQLDRAAKVGFHAAYVLEKGRPVITGPANASVGAYMRDLGLADTVIAYATAAKPEQMRWLSAYDAQSIGLAVLYVEDAPLGPMPSNSEFIPRGDIPVPKAAPRHEAAIATEAQPSLMTRMDWTPAPGYRLVGTAVTIGLNSKTESQCRLACELLAPCVAYSFDIPDQKCMLRSEVDMAIPDRGALSGYRNGTPVAFRR